jgi:hypothetical protein
MFGFGQKKRTAEAIRRGVRASLTGAYFHHSEVNNFGLNEAGSAWLLTEAYAHQFYALGCIASNACGNEKWATFDFFVESLLEGMREYEREGGPNTDQIAPVLLKRYVDFEKLGASRRVEGEHFKASAKLVAEQDESADIDAIAEALFSSTKRYMSDLKRMFG